MYRERYIIKQPQYNQTVKKRLKNQCKPQCDVIVSMFDIDVKQYTITYTIFQLFLDKM